MLYNIVAAAHMNSPLVTVRYEITFTDLLEMFMIV